MTRRHRILWVTNIASPYRRPVWEALGSHCSLIVALLENDDQLNRNGRRGSDWLAPRGESQRYRLHRFRTWMLNRGEEAHFSLRPFADRVLRGCDAVLLGGWDSPAYWQLLLRAKLTGVRVVGFYESTAATNRFRRGAVASARSWFFRRLDGVVVPGEASAALIRSFGVDEHRIAVGFNAVDVETFAARAREARSSSPIAAREGGHHFVYVGQLIERKNVDGLIAAFASVRTQGDRLDLIGTGADQSSLQQLCVRLGVTDFVRFIGFVPNSDLAEVLADEHTLVLPSHQEVWGLVVNEALACGLQVVVAEDAGVAVSVEGMPGVELVGPDVLDLEAALHRARASWIGPVPDPPILRHTPAAFARVFASALGVPWTPEDEAHGTPS